MDIIVKNLKFSYGSSEVLKDISFDISNGNLLCLMGANGVGKTTLFKCILGHKKNFQGDIMINDKDVSSYTSNELAGILAYIPQAKSQNFSFSVLDTVLMGTTHMISSFKTPGKNEIKIAKNALEEIGILNLANKEFSNLSGGEQQLVLIARALAQKSKILLMDEPTSALDYGNQNYIMSKVKDLTKKGYLVILSTHTPEHALNYADKILALDKGKVFAFGDVDKVFDKNLIKTLYDIDIEFIKNNNKKIMYIP